MTSRNVSAMRFSTSRRLNSKNVFLNILTKDLNPTKALSVVICTRILRMICLSASKKPDITICRKKEFIQPAYDQLNHR